MGSLLILGLFFTLSNGLISTKFRKFDMSSYQANLPKFIFKAFHESGPKGSIACGAMCSAIDECDLYAITYGIKKCWIGKLKHRGSLVQSGPKAIYLREGNELITLTLKDPQELFEAALMESCNCYNSQKKSSRTYLIIIIPF